MTIPDQSLAICEEASLATAGKPAVVLPILAPFWKRGLDVAEYLLVKWDTGKKKVME